MPTGNRLKPKVKDDVHPQITKNANVAECTCKYERYIVNDVHVIPERLFGPFWCDCSTVTILSTYEFHGLLAGSR